SARRTSGGRPRCRSGSPWAASMRRPIPWLTVFDFEALELELFFFVQEAVLLLLVLVFEEGGLPIPVQKALFLVFRSARHLPPPSPSRRSPVEASHARRRGQRLKTEVLSPMVRPMQLVSREVPAEGRSIRFRVTVEGREVEAFAVRFQGVVRAYLNLCT